MSHNESIPDLSEWFGPKALPHVTQMWAAASRYTPHFNNLHEAKGCGPPRSLEARDREPPRPLGIVDNTWKAFEQFSKVAMLGILGAFQAQNNGELPPDTDQRIKERWKKWQDDYRKMVREFVMNDTQSPHDVERGAWLYVGEVVELYSKGVRPGVAVDNTLTCADRLSWSSRVIEAYPKVAYLLLINKNRDIEAFAAHPRAYTRAVLNDTLHGDPRRRSRRTSVSDAMAAEAASASGSRVVSSNSKGKAKQSEAQQEGESVSRSMVETAAASVSALRALRSHSNAEVAQEILTWVYKDDGVDEDEVR